MRVAILVLLASVRVAAAYPQFQPGRDITCTGCHISPDGAGLLNENGRTVLETLAFKEMNSELMYGKVPAPDWLQLGGDLRGAAGLFIKDDVAPGAFPMQVDLQARAATHGFSAYVIAGMRPGPAFYSREHYVMWQQKPDENYGLYIRAGHMMPAFGLRLAEHVVYTQLRGGKPLFHEVYALQGSWVSPAFEVHAAGFVHDPYGNPAELGDGGSLYAEARVGTKATIGTEAKVTITDEETVRYTGLTGKLYIEGIDLTLLGEGQLVHRNVKAANDDFNQLVGYIMASKPLPNSLQLDLGVGHFTQDTRVNGDFRDCIDVNVHWYATTHIELLLTTRLELVDSAGGYALTQLHYRL